MVVEPSISASLASRFFNSASMSASESPSPSSPVAVVVVAAPSLLLLTGVVMAVSSGGDSELLVVAVVAVSLLVSCFCCLYFPSALETANSRLELDDLLFPPAPTNSNFGLSVLSDLML